MRSECLRSNERLWCGIVFLVAVAWRSCYLVQAAGDPLFAALAMPDGVGTAPIHPFFGLALDLSRRLFVEPHIALWVVQLFLGSLTALLAWRLGTLLFGHWTGVVSGLVVASYGPMIYATGRFDSVVWVLFLLSAGLVLLARVADRPWLIGLLLGTVAAMMPQTTPMALVALWWISGQRGWNHGLLFAITWLASSLVAVWIADGSAFAPLLALWRQPESWLQILCGPWLAGEWSAQDNFYRGVAGTVAAVLIWEYGVAFPFGILGPVAIVSLVLLWRGRMNQPGMAFAFWSTAASIVGVCIAGGDTATRVTALPMLIVVAAGRLVAWRQDLRSRKALVTQGVPIGLLIVVFNAGGRGLYESGKAYDHYRRGVAYEGLVMKANAIREYEEARGFAAAPVATHAALGRLYAEADNKLGLAAAAYRTALKISPDQHAWREALAGILLRAELPNEAIEELQVLVDQKSDGRRLLGVLGDARLMANDTAGAIEDYSAMIAVAPDSARVLYHLARLYQDAGFKAEALASYQRLRDHSGWRIEAGWRAAALLAELGDSGKAEALLESVLAEEPDSRPGLMGLGRLLAIDGRYAKALPLFEKLELLEPDDYRTHFFLSKIYFRLGRESEAERAFEKYHLGKRRAEIKHSVEEDLEGILRQFGDWAQ